MTNKNLEIKSLLYGIQRGDIEDLRINKNKNRDFFFLKDEISKKGGLIPTRKKKMILCSFVKNPKSLLGVWDSDFLKKK